MHSALRVKGAAMKAENRVYDRLYLAPGRYLACEGIGFDFSGKVSVIGLGGLMVRSDKSFSLGTVLPLRIHSGAQTLDLECIVRDISPDGIGVEFVKLSPANEEALQRIIDELSR
jgi:hypothetical protein